MSDIPPTNHRADIHDTDWLSPYLVERPTDGLWPQRAEHETLIDISGRQVVSLAGTWRFALDQFDNCLRGRWFEEHYTDDLGRELPVDFSFDLWAEIHVPSCWNMIEQEWLWYEGSAVYVRDFTHVDTASGRHFLHFEGANYATYVFLNGRYVGWHLGGSTPFSLEVTGLLSSENRLIVVVNNARRPERVPAENTDWFNYGGLHRDVCVVSVPDVFIQRAEVQLRPDGTFSTIDVSVYVSGTTGASQGAIRIPSLGLAESFNIVDGMGRFSLSARPELWEPESPILHTVELRVGADLWTDRVGFREISVKGHDILLNGRSIFLKGVCLHEDSLTFGRSLTTDDVRNDVHLARQLGCNYMRLSHYPHSREVSRIADEVGMLLWEEVPVYWAIDFTSSTARRDAHNQMSELVRRDVNRASVIIWSVGNENPDTDDRLSFMTSLVATVRSLDTTRLVSAACLVDPSVPVISDRLVDEVDLIGVNEYYGWYERDLDRLPLLFSNSHPDKPVVVCEFGADAVAGLHGGSDELLTEEFQVEVYRHQLEVLAAVPYVRGLSPWVLSDFRSPRRAHARQGYFNLKGLTDVSRTHHKLAFSTVQAFYASRHVSELPR